MLRSRPRLFSLHHLTAALMLMGFASTFSGCVDEIRDETPALVPVIGLPPDGVTDPNIIADQFIAIMKENLTPAQRAVVAQDLQLVGSTILHTYDYPNAQGFLLNIPAASLEHVRRIEELSWIEADRHGQVNAGPGLQTCPPWNLDVLDHQSAPGSVIDPLTMIDRMYAYGATGKGITVVVVDTGIRADPAEVDNATVAKPPDAFVINSMCDPDDAYGHGTMVAEIVAGHTFGVAKEATVMPYNATNMAWCRDTLGNQQKVCKPPMNGTLCPQKPCDTAPTLSADFEALHNIALEIGPGKTLTKGKTIVLLPHAYVIDKFNPQQFPDQNAMVDAVGALAGAGGILVTSAGNPASKAVAGGQVAPTSDACDFLPASLSQSATQVIAEHVITVGGIDSAGAVGPFNTGPCVDVYAPALALPAHHPGNTACAPVGGTTMISGTSFAAAHAAGVAALFLEKNLALPDFKTSFLAASTRGMQIGGLPGPPNKIVHSADNVAESGSSDADGNMDKTVFCEGIGCVCSPADSGPNPCNVQNPAASCTEEFRCTGAECARCGREDDICCSIGDPCFDNLACISGICACGGKAEPCCVKGAPACDLAWLACDGEGKCVECGDSGQPCCGVGECNGSDLQCLDGKCQACDTNGAPCCVSPGGGDYCVGDDLQCVSGSCETCGATGSACCPGATPCADIDASCEAGKCVKCGGPDEACCSGYYCLGDLSCEPAQNGKYLCKPKPCGATGAACCPGVTPCADIDASCEAGKCVKCGGPGEVCCSGYSCLGNMACLPDKQGNYQCNGSCWVRCQSGKYSTLAGKHFVDADACGKAAQNQCVEMNGMDAARIFYNYKPIYIVDDWFPGNCGENGRYCCYQGNDSSNDAVAGGCQQPDGGGASCVRFQPMNGADGWQQCRTCGGSGDVCCQDGQTSYCGKDLNCNGNKCTVPCGASGQDCCIHRDGTKYCTSNLACDGNNQCN